MTVNVLPAPVGEFQREARSSSGLASRLALAMCSRKRWPAFARVSAGDLGEPDGGFDGLDLAEEGADAALKLWMPPVLEEALRFGFDEPVGGIFEFPPFVDFEAEVIDDRGGVVLLGFGGEAGAFVENDLDLVFCFLFFGPGDWGDEFGFAAGRDDSDWVGKTVFEFLMCWAGALVWRIQDGAFRKSDWSIRSVINSA